MKKYIALFTIFFALVFSGCGGGGGSSSNATSETNSSTTGTAQLGNLANADVTIYKIENNGLFSPLWHEKTSSGTKLNTIGKFNTHSKELNNEDYYLYKVVGGEDWDADDNGNLDINYTENNGIIRLIAKGSDIKSANNNLRVTYVSEIIYEKVAKKITSGFNKAKFQTQLKDAISTILKDTNGSDSVNIQNMIKFNPVENKNKLNNSYRSNLQNILNNVHQGKKQILDIPKLEDNNNTQNIGTNAVVIRSVAQGIEKNTDILINKKCGDRGGVAIYTGIDINKNGILDDSERRGDPQIVCNGKNGSSSNFSIKDIKIGDSTCPLGGIKIITSLNNHVFCNESNANISSSTDFTKPGSIEGKISVINTRSINRNVISMKGGLWLTPQKVQAAIDEGIKTRTKGKISVPTPIIKPIPIKINKDNTYKVTDVPLSLIHI
jgi:hypothetical protein